MVTHKGTQTIQTERLTLRRFKTQDAQPMFCNWANDERVTHFLTWASHGSPELTRELLEAWCADYENSNVYNWAIELDGEAIGSIGVANFSDRSEWAELGYCIGYDFWNKGIMTEAVGAVIGYLFREIGVNRISILHAVKNPASGRVAQKCGLTYEGTKREYFKAASGELLDIAEYAILKKDWDNI